MHEADRQLREGGYHHLNFAMIADRLGTTRANLHYHFQNKHGLAAAALDRYLNEQEEGLKAFVTRNPGDFPGFLRTLYGAIWDRMRACQFEGHCLADRLVNEGCDVPADLREKAADFNGLYLTVFSGLIGESQLNGTIRDDRDPELIAREALALLLGITQILRILPGERIDGSPTTQVLEQWLGRIAGA